MYFSGRLSTQKLHSICYQTQPVVKSGSHKDYYGDLNFDRHLANLDVFKRVLTSVAVFAYSEVRIHATLKENMAKDV